jgi:hypothetical protein
MNTSQIIKIATTNLLEKKQMQTADIYCLRVHEAGFAFGARTDNGEQVYIPPGVVRGAGVKEDEVVNVTMIVNTHPNSDHTPWCVIRVNRNAAPAAPQPVAPPVENIDDRVLQLVREQGMITTAEVAQEFPERLNATSAHNLMMRLFAAGKLAKADVYARPDQGRASFCLWATDVKVFAGEDV